ncbi:hypothetical protein EPO15_13125, partial [bacterium]
MLPKSFPKIWLTLSSLMLVSSHVVFAAQDPRVFIPDFDHNMIRTVNLVNPGFGAITLGITAPWARGMVATPNGKYSFVANGLGSTVISRIPNNDNNPMPTQITLGFAPYDMEVSADSKLLFIGANQRLIVVDVETLAMRLFSLGSIPGIPDANGQPQGTLIFNVTNSAIGIAPDMSSLYVHAQNIAAPNTNVVIVFKDVAQFMDGTRNINSYWRATLPSSFANPPHLLFARDGQRAFVGASNGAYVIDAVNRAVIAGSNVTFPTPILDLQIMPNGNYVYAGAYESAKVFKLHSQTLALMGTIPLYNAAAGEWDYYYRIRGVAFRADNSKLFASVETRSGSFSPNSFVRTVNLPDGGGLQSIDAFASGLIGRGEVVEALAGPDVTPPQFSNPLVALGNVGIFSDPTNAV